MPVNNKKIIEMLDSMAEQLNQPTMSETLKKFSDKIPPEMRATVLSQVKEDVANSVKQSLEKTLHEINEVVSDDEVISKLKDFETRN